jgi:hypothetical protein
MKFMAKGRREWYITWVQNKKWKMLLPTDHIVASRVGGAAYRGIACSGIVTFVGRMGGNVARAESW